MTSFFSEMGRRLGDRLLALLVLPGLLLVFAVGVAATLGHTHALDWHALVREADKQAATAGAHAPMAQVLLLVVGVLGTIGIGLAVGALSSLTQRLWLGMWPSWASVLAERLTRRRVMKWENAHTAVKAASDQGPTEADLLAARRNEIAMARPTRPTWMGDRIAAVDQRVHNQYGVDLQSWWPRLWLILDETGRNEIRAARTAFDAATSHATWASGYALVGLLWWPAFLIAAGIGITGWLRGRDATRTYADLIESTVDVHARTLAIQLGALTADEKLTITAGQEVTAQLRKGA